MLMVIDIGNTQTVVGVYNGEKLQANWRLSTDHSRTADETWIIIKMWCEAHGIEISQLNGMVISSVVPTLTSVFNQMAKERLFTEPLVISSELDTGLTIHYDPIRSVGADRICNAVAGFRLYGGPLVILDFGTATTFDVVSSKAEYLGGLIALGLIGASQELHRRSAVLPRVALEFPPTVIGSSTETSMQSGILWGTVAMIEGVIERIKKELEIGHITVVATGGLADIFAERSPVINEIEPFLTLKGMKYIWQRVYKSVP